MENVRPPVQLLVFSHQLISRCNIEMSESTESISLGKYRKYKFNCVLSTVCQLCSINIDCIILHLHVSLSKYAPVVHTSTIWIIFCTEANDFLYNMWH